MKYSADVLVEHAACALEHEGLPREHASTVAKILVDADMRGHRSHGLSLLPVYIHRIRSGGIVPEAVPQWIREDSAVAILDAKGGPGQIAARLAAERCCELAAESGVAAVAIRNNNHIGMLAAYRHPFQHAGITGLLLNLAGTSVTPPGGVQATLGNNAVCLIVPQPKADPFIIDFATGVVACGKIREAAAKGESIPSGWLVDRSGRPSIDPDDLDEGGAVPVFGGHKGLGVSLIVELLAGAIAGRVTSMQINRQRIHPDRIMGCSQFYLGINPTIFGVETLVPYIDDLDRAVRSAYLNEPKDIYFPEQLETRSTAQGQREGLDVAPEVIKILGLAHG